MISNTIGEPGATLRPILTSMGFDEVVEEYLFSDELPWTKPDPAIFLEALRRLGSDPSHAVHVGDGWPDIEGPKRTGMKAGILYTGLQTYGAEYQRLFLPPDGPPRRPSTGSNVWRSCRRSSIGSSARRPDRRRSPTPRPCAEAVGSTSADRRRSACRSCRPRCRNPSS